MKASAAVVDIFLRPAARRGIVRLSSWPQLCSFGAVHIMRADHIMQAGCCLICCHVLTIQLVTLESGLCVVLFWFLPDTLPAVMRPCLMRDLCLLMRACSYVPKAGVVCWDGWALHPS